MGGVVFGVFIALLIYATLSSGFDVRSLGGYIVMSGSMAPEIPIGSVVLVKPESFYYSNQIVTFKTGADGKSLVTHRITELKPTQTYYQYQYQTKGDANKEGDLQLVDHQQIVGKVFLTVPWLGYLANTAKTQKGFIFLIIVPATIIVYEELKFLGQEGQRFVKKVKKNSSLPGFEKTGSVSFLPKLLLVVPLVGGLLFFLASSGAVFSHHQLIPTNLMQTAANWKEAFIAKTAASSNETENTNTNDLLSPEPTAIMELDSTTDATPDAVLIEAEEEATGSAEISPTPSPLSVIM